MLRTLDAKMLQQLAASQHLHRVWVQSVHTLTGWAMLDTRSGSCGLLAGGNSLCFASSHARPPGLSFRILTTTYVDHMAALVYPRQTC